MKLSAPKKWVWYVSIIFGIVSIVGRFVVIPYVSAYIFWIFGIAWLLLVISTRVKGF